MAGAKSKTLPVMAQTIYTQVPDYVKDGIVTSLQPQVDGKNGLSKKQLNNIYPGFLQQSKYKGEFYSAPFSASVREMFYNKTLVFITNTLFYLTTKFLFFSSACGSFSRRDHRLGGKLFQKMLKDRYYTKYLP